MSVSVSASASVRARVRVRAYVCLTVCLRMQVCVPVRRRGAGNDAAACYIVHAATLLAVGA
eukprot:6200527-Pleurochrysis_carterae.AAC.4